MSITEHRGGGIILLSFIAAFSLTITPLPGDMEILIGE